MSAAGERFYVTYEDGELGGKTYRTPDYETEAEADAKAEELCAAGFRYVLVLLAD